jgi:hypothetical protein
MTKPKIRGGKHSKFINHGVKLLATTVMTLLVSVIALAQAGGGSADLKEKVAALKQSAAANQQKLHQYQWTEVQQIALKGETKSENQSMCQYGPDGKVQKTPMGPPPEQPSGGRMKQKVIAKKKEEMQDYMGDVKTLLAQYVPPNPQKIQQAFAAGTASISPNPSAGLVNLVFRDYAEPGDQMTIAFDGAAKKIAGVNVNTYMGEAKDAVTLVLDFSSLPDGTNYVEKTVLNATAKQLVVTTTNTNYRKLGGM